MSFPERLRTATHIEILYPLGATTIVPVEAYSKMSEASLRHCRARPLSRREVIARKVTSRRSS